MFPIPRFGRDNFQEAMKISNRVPESMIDWKKFKYMVFDMPALRSSYAERYAELGITTLFTCDLMLNRFLSQNN